MASRCVKSKKYTKAKVFASGKTDYGIPTFSFKSSLVIMLGAVNSTFIVPYILSFIGIDFKLGVMIGNATITSYALAYSRYFIETNKKYCKGFWITYGGFALAFCIIAFFWMYLNAYI